MKRYVIERNVPGVGGLESANSSRCGHEIQQALAKLSGKVQWEHSFVAGDKTFCIYRADTRPPSGTCSAKRVSGEQVTKLKPLSTR